MLNHTPFLCINEIESMASICFRAFEDINYRVRCSVAKLLGTLVAMTQLSSSQTLFNKNNHKNISSSLSDGGDDNCSGNGGTGEIIKGNSTLVNREVRVGATHAYVIFVQILGGTWLERNTNIMYWN
ncbi:hypothetical protein HCN44_006017 [Aphidius gifuensis]|uniref:Uncharacterized protein n=1 Tax=Aphidius gifuensis TaxID=684658 RepID=A0A834Y3P2_APHGI|nr:hypothetical protein HCN44_006017 [Aphidius gifuensis]